MPQLIVRTDELYHHGIKGMHWGIRRYQQYDDGPSEKKKKQKFIDYAEKRNKKIQKSYSNAIQRARRTKNYRLENKFETFAILHKSSADRMMRNLENTPYNDIKYLARTRRGRYNKAIEQAYWETMDG